MRRDISVLIPTFNRAAGLRRTLEALQQVRRHSLNIEIVVIDNGSSDGTHEVASAFASALPIKYLVERSPGKGCALNRAMEVTELGELVVFTDDDVTPTQGWLGAIAAAAREHSEVTVFGGRVLVEYPEAPPPVWAIDPRIVGWGFARLDLGDAGCEWPATRFPSGPNFWVRQSVINEGFRFDEHLGPKPKRRILGDESRFVKKIADAGNRIRYVPESVVYHRIQPELLSLIGIHRRAIQVGRATPHLWGLCRPALLARSKALWSLVRVAATARAALRFATAAFRRNSAARIVASTGAIRAWAFNLESLRLVWWRKESWSAARLRRSR